MARITRIDRLPAELRELIGRLRSEGQTHRAIHAALLERGVTIAFSTLRDHLRKIDREGRELRRSRRQAEVLIERLGSAPEPSLAPFSVELLQARIMDMLTPRDGAPELGVRDLRNLAAALATLASALKADAQREQVLRREFAREAAGKAVAVARGAGLTPELAARFRAAILGLAAPETARAQNV
jgi:hypothetical protein